jgi:hypothetical protein
LFHPLLLLAVLLASPGCATLTLGTIATAIGVAGSAVSTGNAVFSQGKLDSAEMSTTQNWLAAVRLAAGELHLTLKEEPHATPNTPHYLTLSDDHGSTISIRVERRTETLLRSRISVGLFGSEPTARLLLSRIRHHAGTEDLQERPR